MCTIGDVCGWIDRTAPFSLAEEWDNVGILAGSADAPVSAILCALELNERVLSEAIEKQAQLIVTHHPILFRGRKNLREDDAEGRLLCRLIRERIGLIAAHTNFDNAQPGVNDALAEALSLTDVSAGVSGMRIGTPKQKTLGAFMKHAGKALGSPIRCYGEAERRIHRVAVLGGAGGDFATEAAICGADVYLTGEISHHRACDACENGLCILEAGHAATEQPAVKLLAGGLQNAADGVQCDIRIFLSESELFG